MGLFVGRMREPGGDPRLVFSVICTTIIIAISALCTFNLIFVCCRHRASRKILKQFKGMFVSVLFEEGMRFEVAAR